MVIFMCVWLDIFSMSSIWKKVSLDQVQLSKKSLIAKD